MVSFFVYDLGFLILFSLGVWWFLRKRRDELSREGWMFMWRTQFGVKAIAKFTSKFGFVMKRMKWLIVGIGGLLMGIMLWMLGQTTIIYLLHSSEITKVMKAPPIAPLIPYFPKLFGMENIFPPFYFTYFILALAIVAIAHEFSHGVFMKLFKIKIKSTGLVFLGPILGAFVEQSEKSMKSKKKLDQMTVLAAGVFANVLVAILFYILYILFFFSSFAASGYIFNSYGVHQVPLSSIDMIGEDMGTMNVLLGGQSADMNLSEVEIMGKKYLMSTDVKNFLLKGVNIDNHTTFVLEIAPAVLAGMKGAIIQADDVKILGHATLGLFLQNKNPGDIVRFTTDDEGDVEEYDVILAEHPNENIDYGYLGVGYNAAEPKGIIQNILSKFMGFKEASTHYTPTWDGDFVYFIYYLLWWIMIINLLVALFNMLPLGMLDGGRFLYLGIWGIFGSEKWAKRFYKFATYFILLMFVLMMIFWFIGIW